VAISAAADWLLLVLTLFAGAASAPDAAVFVPKTQEASW
jgi:hypothetical protein